MKHFIIISLLIIISGCASTGKECTQRIPDANKRYAEYCETKRMFDVKWNDTQYEKPQPKIIINADGNKEIVYPWQLPEGKQ